MCGLAVPKFCIFQLLHINLKKACIFLPVELNGYAKMWSLSWSDITFMKSVGSLQYTELTTESYCYPHESDVTQFF